MTVPAVTAPCPRLWPRSPLAGPGARPSTAAGGTHFPERGLAGTGYGGGNVLPAVNYT